MARRSLKPQLNQIRSWVTEGRTDAWIAHQLEVSVGELVSFKREHDLAPPADGDNGPPFGGDEEDLRAQDDALVAAALDAEPDADDEEDDGDAAGDAADAAGAAAVRAARVRSRAPSTTARRATACGSTPQSRTTPRTPSIGPGIARCPSPSSATGS